MKPKLPISVDEAKRILGTAGNLFSDETITKLILQVEALSDVVIANANDSNIHSCVEISDKHADNGT